MGLLSIIKNSKLIIAGLVLSASACVNTPNPADRCPPGADWFFQQAEKYQYEGNDEEYKNCIGQARDKYAEIGWYQDSGDLDALLGNIDSACEYYEKAYSKYHRKKWKRRAKEMASKLGSFADQSGNPKLAIKYYTYADQPGAIADVANKSEDYELAFKNYLEIEDRVKIFELGERLGFKAKREGNYQKAMDYFAAAAEAKKGEFNRAYLDAAVCAEKLFLMHDAKELYEKFTPFYLTVWKEEMDAFKERTKIAVSRLVERGDLEQAIRIADIVSVDYQKRVRASLHHLRQMNKTQ